MPSDYTDGDILADSFEATIAGDGYVVNNLSLTTPSTMVERNDAKGKLAAKQLLKDFRRINGTAELQIDSEAANVELWGETFTVPADYNTTGYPLVCIVEEETANVEANASRTRSVNIRFLYIDAMVVEDAGTTAANGIYLRDGDFDGKPLYSLVGGGASDQISWVTSLSKWLISSDYESTDDVATPDLVTTWTVASGTAPAPTVTRLTFADLAAL